MTRARRFLLLVYWGGAAALVPWIVVLYHQQAPRGLAHHVHLVGYGISALMVAGMVATAMWCRSNSHYTVIAGTSTAAMVFITAWFNTVTSTHARLALTVTYAVVVQIPVVVACAVVVRALFRPHGAHAGPPVLVANFLLGSTVVVVPLVILALQGAPSVRVAVHLRLVWTGLDVLELVGMAGTGWCLRRSLPRVAVVGSLSGTLLFCDAWFNVVATTGAVQLAGVAMAGLELPLAALSFALARREVRHWPEASPLRRPA
jgi:hypothetical protein